MIDSSQLFAITALMSAIIDAVVLAAVAWQYKDTIRQSRSLRLIYPIAWGVFLVFGWTYWQILFEPDNYDFAVKSVARPFNTVVLNTLLVIVMLATAHSAKILAQAHEIQKAHQEAIAAEQELVESQKRSLEERENYLVIIGHELRTPLHIIVMYLSMFLEFLPAISEELPKESEAIKHIERFAQGAIDGSARLRVMLRMFSAITERPHYEPVNLCDVVEQAINDADLYTATRRERGHVAVNLQCRPVIVEADFKMLETAVFALVQNAIKATAKGYIQVVVSEKSDFATIAVEDTGKGVPQEIRNRIWEPGFQDGSNHMKRPDEGAGYGLATVLHVARAHGGDAALEESEVGKGSRFAIYIPIK
jgi:signal transduction histidine kinase